MNTDHVNPVSERANKNATLVAKPELHPACALFPEMDPAELRALADDIKANGLREPILKLPDGQILDGRSRLKACEMAGVEPRFEYYEGDKTPAEIVYSANVVRRHLTPIQCASALAELLDSKHGGDRKSSGAQRLLKAQKDLCAQHGIGDTMLKEARAVKKANCPELLNALISGKLSSKKAAEIARDKKAIKEINGGASVEDIAVKKGLAVKKTKAVTSSRVEKKDQSAPLAISSNAARPIQAPQVEAPVETEHQKVMKRFERQMETLSRYMAESVEKAQHIMQSLDALVDALSTSDAIKH